VLITEENVDPKTAQGILRHATSSMTMERVHSCSGSREAGGSGPVRVTDGAVMESTGRKSQVNFVIVFVGREPRYNGINT